MQSFAQIFLVFLLVVAGAGLTLQATVNARLREAVGSPALSALISFAVGAVPLALAVAFGLLGRGRLTGLAGNPWWIWIGGLFGAFYVTLSVVGVPRVGTAVVIACAVGGQLTTALILDSFGWLGVPRAPLSIWRVGGVLLVFAGVLLVQHRK